MVLVKRIVVSTVVVIEPRGRSVSPSMDSVVVLVELVGKRAVVVDDPRFGKVESVIDSRSNMHRLVKNHATGSQNMRIFFNLPSKKLPSVAKKSKNGAVVAAKRSLKKGDWLVWSKMKKPSVVKSLKKRSGAALVIMSTEQLASSRPEGQSCVPSQTWLQRRQGEEMVASQVYSSFGQSSAQRA